jgi:hypothetical protein
MKFVKAIVTVAAISLLAVPAMAGKGPGNGNGSGDCDQIRTQLRLDCYLCCQEGLCDGLEGLCDCGVNCAGDCDGIPDEDGNQYGERKGGGDGVCNDPDE